ncbi:MAG TPA: GGDEF domain-containing protein [Rhizomicrobium sp.]|nr:GGDEF domain-containing protein [Rhizomicrobium sp.]
MTPRARAIVAALNGEVEMLRRDLELARTRLALAEQAADQDQLLPILNRRAFMRALNWHTAAAARYGTPASLLYCDLDGFKRINDAHGHAGGDAVLAHVAKILRANIRESDILGRLGGDEFGILLTHANAEQATNKAHALAKALATEMAEWNGTQIAVSFSFGAFELCAGESAETALMRADEAMYAQKRARPSAAE